MYEENRGSILGFVCYIAQPIHFDIQVQNNAWARLSVLWDWGSKKIAATNAQYLWYNKQDS